MKTQMTKALAILFCLTVCLSAYAQKKTVELKGSWNYSLPDAPQEYQKGTIAFKEADEKLTATVKLQGNTVTINEIKKEDDKYTCNLTVDGSYVKIVFTPEADKITGMVTAEGWDMPITLTAAK